MLIEPTLASSWFIQLAGENWKCLVSCYLHKQQDPPVPVMKGLHAQQLLCFLQEHPRGWEIPSPCNCPPYHHRCSNASASQGSFSQQRAAALWSEHDRSWESCWSQKKASGDDGISACAVLCKAVLTSPHVSEQAFPHPSPAASVLRSHCRYMG